MTHNYDNFEEKNALEEEVEEEIKTLLKQIKNEKIKVQADMYTEKTKMSSKEREKEGRAINNLVLAESRKIKYLTYLKFIRKEKIRTEIKKGDLALLTINGEEINCQIDDISFNSVSIVTGEKVPRLRKNNPAKIDFILNETTFRRWETNLRNLNENGRKALKYKKNRIATKPDAENNKITFFNENLDKYQKQAVERAITSNDFFLIHGPFGTGKTTTIIEIILQEVKLNHTVLVSGESNTAIDNILKKLKKKHNKLNFTRVGTSDKIPPNLRQYTLDYKIKQYLDNNEIDSDEKQEIIDEILENSDVILTTNSSAGAISLSNIEFNIAIIDEASQATIPSVLIPINKAKKFILIGDHKQLPPVVLNDNAKYLKKSLFEELITNYKHQSQELLIQYRMNEILMKFPNKKFYENKLKCSKKSKNYYLNKVLKKYDSTSPLIFIDTSKHENNKEKTSGLHSYTNDLEIGLVLEIINMYLDKGIHQKDIGVIAPYAKQVMLIKEKREVAVRSVDGFQGGEKDIIIISLVRSNDNEDIGFLKDFQRLNVSLTRAKKKLIIIGNRETFESYDGYEELLEFCEGLMCIHTLH